MSKLQIAIHLSRKLTLNRVGHEPVALAAGRNVVDRDVAEHPFVKHHSVEVAAVVGAENVEALHANLAELEKHVADARTANAEMRAAYERLQAANGRLLDEKLALDKTVADLTADANALREQLAQKDADMQALVASMQQPAGETKKGGK